jgi:SagB-type dehydrogenase family enzyme
MIKFPLFQWSMVGFLFVGCISAESSEKKTSADTSTIILSTPRYESTVSVERAIFNRKSIRTYTNASLSKKEIAQLLWAGGGKTIDGVTGATRSYPSAGGLYPIELYLVAEKVDSLVPGIYHYNWRNHSIKLMKKGYYIKNIKVTTYSNAFQNVPLPACIVATAVYSRTISRYKDRGKSRYVPMDMGGCGENISLQAVSLGLGTFIIGAFMDEELRKIIGVSPEETPFYIMPVGRP